MELSPGAFLIVCPLVFLAGFVDSVAGGGGLISLPAYLLAGLPMHFSLGTNKLSSTLGAITASYRYYRHGRVDTALALPSVAAALGGSALGSYLSLLADPAALQKLLILALPVTAYWVLRPGSFQERPAPLPRAKTFVSAALISLAAGCYDGFFGPGTGAFLILLYTGLARLEPRTAAGNAKFVNLASNAAALGMFLWNRRVILPLGAAAGCFSILGSYLGAGLALKRGAKLIRFFIILVLLLLFIKTGWELWKN